MGQGCCVCTLRPCGSERTVGASFRSCATKVSDQSWRGPAHCVPDRPLPFSRVAAHTPGMEEPRRYIVDVAQLPDAFPTHCHAAEFWAALGRAVATFGFLEETLGKAIFAFTATRPYLEEEISAAYERWLPTLERALSDQLGSLIDTYAKVVRRHVASTIDNLPDLVFDLKAASVVRNVICHGSWGLPDSDGRSLPLFVNRKNEKFETPIDVAFLNSLQRHTAQLVCAVVNSVTHMGWQFPGSSGPGVPIVPRDNQRPA
jgi:hypothetical protein